MANLNKATSRTAYKIVIQLFTYNKKTGILYWKNPKGRGRNYRAGFDATIGYRYVSIDYVWCLEHRIIWLLVTGKWPKQTLDHKNNVRNDNKWNNLREATKSQNNCNRGITSTNTSGFKGVSWHAQQQKWRAQIVIKKCYFSLGVFSTREKAGDAYSKAAMHLHKKFARKN